MPKLTKVDVANHLNQLGVQLYKDQKFFEAMMMFKRLQHLVDNYDVQSNIAACLIDMGKYGKGATYLSRALREAPLNPQVLSNYAKLLTLQGDLKQAEAELTRVLDMDPTNHRARLDRAFTRLEGGNWTGGFVDYESRMDVWPDRFKPMGLPKWSGEDLSGKTLYVEFEQGLGDMLSFSRFVPEVKRRWPDAKIMYCCGDPRLQDLMWYYRDVAELVTPGLAYSLVAADYGCRLMSLPGIMGITPDHLPADPGFLRQRAYVDYDKPGGRVNLTTEFGDPIKVGICWSGNPKMADNKRRSIPFNHILELATNNDIMLFSLQLGPAREQMINAHGQELIVDLSPHLNPENGMVAMAKTMLALDIVVTCCTSVAHLAGALGVPTILMLSNAPYWVWGRSGKVSIWHPSIRMVRQQVPGDWEPVLQKALAMIRGTAH